MPGADEPTADAVNSFVDTGAITGIGLFGSRGWTVDEIRFGNSLADVTAAAVPEPRAGDAGAFVARSARGGRGP